MPVYDEKYIKAKVKEFHDVANANFWRDKLPKEGVLHTFIACIGFDYIMKMEKRIIHEFI